MEVSRRTMLRAAGAAALGAGLTPLYEIPARAADLPTLPSGVSAYRGVFQNWAGEVVTDPLWTARVRSADQVVALANWASANGWRLRPTGFRHNWSPLTVADGTTSDAPVLLVDTRNGLTRLSLGSGTVTVGAGVSLDTLLSTLDLRGRGLAHNPAPGDITVGGALAIGAHGTGVPALGQRTPSGHSFGSLSNLVTSLQAVVWDPAQSRYVARTFSRAERESGALLVNLGRAFLLEVTLRTGPAQKMRCVSRTDIRSTELFAPAGSRGRTLASYLESAGRVEAIWFPFTNAPWLKVWSVSRSLLPPLGSRLTVTPYNYPFSDSIPEGVNNLIQRVRTDPPAVRNWGAEQLSITRLGLAGGLSYDIWGSAANLTRYVRPSTLKVTANGYAVLCRRSDVQWVVNSFCDAYTADVNAEAAQNRYPVNGPVEIRVTGVDQPADSLVAGAQDPWLSPSRRRPDRPEWDCVVWLDLLTFPGTPGSAAFYARMENWLLRTFDGNRAAVRVEWSKGWGYTPEGGAWTSPEVIGGFVPDSLQVGQPAGTGFWDAVEVLNALDPSRVFSSPLLDWLLPA